MKEQTTQLVDFFKVFADETRMEILELLARGEKPTREITDELGKSQSTISQHMKILVNSGLVEFTTDGKKKTYHITTPDIHAVVNAVKSMVTKLSQMNANQVSEDSIYNIGGNAAKILLMGLSNSGKTCIAHSLEENTNLLSHLTLEPTKKCQIIKLNAGSKEYNIWDFGGQERHLDSHLDDEKTFLGANKLIYVIDIQDEDSHEPALEYLKKIVEKIRKGGLEIQVSVFLHKFDPELELDGKLATIGDGLKKKIAAIIPSEMGYKIFKTTIYTMFQQNRFYPL